MAWVSLDERDDDPRAFWAYLRAAVAQAAAGPGAPALAGPAAPGGPGGPAAPGGPGGPAAPGGNGDRAEPTDQAMDAPEIDHPTITAVMNDLRIPGSDLGPGDPIPAFDLPTTVGGRVSSADLAGDGRPTLLVFGSLTCPVTESGAAGIRALHARYGPQVRFLMVNVREAHPGASTGQPRTFEQKLSNARELKAHHAFAVEVAIDDLDGTLHRAFGPRPNSAYLIDHCGTIVFRDHWANVTSALEPALAAITAGRTIPRPRAGHTLQAMAIRTGHADVAFAAAGKGALADTWKVAPPSVR